MRPGRAFPGARAATPGDSNWRRTRRTRITVRRCAFGGASADSNSWRNGDRTPRSRTGARLRAHPGYVCATYNTAETDGRTART